ncbi:hypothetical protein GQ54DRAFT_212005 [Martensiomyces pterosporus]|nr:hypothetical protein GQ54DRAFT_212005 [Martensiomyces pterosporus]
MQERKAVKASNGMPWIKHAIVTGSFARWLKREVLLKPLSGLESPSLLPPRSMLFVLRLSCCLALTAADSRLQQEAMLGSSTFRQNSPQARTICFCSLHCPSTIQQLNRNPNDGACW